MSALSAPVSLIPFGVPVVTVNAAADVRDAFDVLIENQISSVPVYDHARDQYIGFFDVADMNQYVVDALAKTSEPEADPLDIKADLREIIAEVTRLTPNGVDVMANLSKNNPFYPVTPDTSILKVLDLFGTHGIKRVPVLSAENGKLTAIITQSNLLAHLLAEIPSSLKFLGDVLAKDSTALKAVHCVSEQSSALRAMELLLKHNISGMGIVGDEGELVATISNSDLRAMTAKKKFPFVGITAIDWIAQSRTQMDGATERAAVVSIHLDDTILDGAKKLAKAGLHRVFIVDENNKPKGVLTLKDVLRMVYNKHCGAARDWTQVPAWLGA